MGNLVPISTPKAAAGAAEQTGSGGALVRGLRILEALTGAVTPLPLSTISEIQGLPANTTMRLLRSLEEAGYVIRTENGWYLGSPRCFLPLPLFHPLNQLRREAQPSTNALSAKLRQTVILTLFIQRQRMVLDVVQYPGSPTPVHDTWLTSPLHATSSGLVYLLGLAKEDRDAALGPEPLPQLTPATARTRGEVHVALAELEIRGYCAARDTYKNGVTVVAAPLRLWDGRVVGSLQACAYSDAFEQAQVDACGAELVKHAGLLLCQASSLAALTQLLVG